jgi:hypothetical protein
MFQISRQVEDERFEREKQEAEKLRAATVDKAEGATPLSDDNERCGSALLRRAEEDAAARSFEHESYKVGRERCGAFNPRLADDHNHTGGACLLPLGHDRGHKGVIHRESDNAYVVEWGDE